MALSQEQVDEFWENGFVSYGQILDADELELFRREYDDVFARARQDNTYCNLSTAATAGEASAAEMLQIMQMSERSIHFRRLLYHDRILDVVQDLIGPNMLLFHDQALFKPALTGGRVTWHQDNAYWKCSPANLVSCWLTLDDATKENGAMQLIPGSHLKPLRHQAGDSGSPLLDLERSVDSSQAKVMDLPAGGCMFHHCQTLHYTSPNTTDRQRRAFAIHFMPPGTRDAGGAVIHVGFAHPMLRMRM